MDVHHCVDKYKEKNKSEVLKESVVELNEKKKKKIFYFRF